ncbi:RhoGAP-domain-containing protein [Hysterangium stoloniferum]|nr:RhoGAP-domain-containing protein [Hysterangium stoloniferum]
MISNAQLGPLPYFDFHVKTLEDSYIQFFQERIRIEEFYVDALQRLHLRHRALDSYRDDRSDRGTTVRKAWREVGDNAERETQTRGAFLEVLKSEVLAPLLDLKETQERTRKRIKEDLKLSTETHVEYAESVLPRLKRSYLKKCQDVEDYKPDKVIASLSTEHDLPLSKVTSNPIGSPMPIRPLNRQSSVHHTSGVVRNRSPPSSSIGFVDLAHQGKKQFNSMINFLNEGNKNGTSRENLGRSEAAVRSVRAKREADDAEKEYRKAVHWLETLRLRRVKTLESGYGSLESLIFESAETLKQILTKYADSLIATSSTIVQLTNHVAPIIKAISPPDDTAFLTNMVSKAMVLDIPKPVLYYNYMVGECRDLIFGVALVDYSTAHNLPEGTIPKIVEICVKEIETRGIDIEGLYRISGRIANVQELKAKMERDERKFKFNPAVDDVPCIASLLKLYLRELPEPVFRFPLAERVQHTEDREGHIAKNFPLLRSKLRRLPPVHQATLRCLVEHLARVSSRSQYNKMDARNLAIVFNGVIFGEDELPKDTDILAIHNIKDTVMEDLIVHAPLLFDDRTIPVLHEPPLPPAPSGEPKPKYDYGSSYTRTHTLLPRPQDSQDFTPRLPPRPEQSIHPSHRNNQPTKTDSPNYSPPSTTPVKGSDPVPSLSSPRNPTASLPSLTAVGVVSDVDPPHSPRTPDTFTTAVSLPLSSPRDKTSPPPSRPSTAHT